MSALFSRSLAALALLTLLAPLSASAAPPIDDDTRFELLLKSIDVVPPDRAGFERAFPDAKARLLDAAAQADRDEYTRTRAISLLSFFPDSHVQDALLALASDETPFVRKIAIYTVARGFGRTVGPDVVARVEAAAADVDAAVRERAVRGLRWIDHRSAGVALKRLASKSTWASVRALAARTDTRRAQRLSR